MSVIQTIRNKYGKIAGAVIAIALVGFIVSDARNGSFGNFFGGRETQIMKVDGVKIEPKEYQQRLKEYETLYAMFNSREPKDDLKRAQINEQVISMIAYETYVEEQCAKLGIQTSEEEKKELIYGGNADNLVKQYQIEGNMIFINKETNSFDPGYVKAFEKQLADDGARIDPAGKIRESWEMTKSYVLRMSNINKFNTMFAGAAYVPTYLAKRTAADQNSMASIRYVKIPLSSVNDADVKVSDEEIKTYMAAHKAMFETDQPSRSIEYVSFDIIPASADTARALGSLEEIKAEFGTTKDNKAFVNNKSDEVNSFSEAYYSKNTFKSRFADSIMAVPAGNIYGPYYEDNAYKLTKVISRKTLPDSVKFKHILVRVKAQGKDIMSDTAAKMKIDSAIAEIKAGVKFDSVVMKYSDDNDPKKKGSYDWTLVQRPGLPDTAMGDFIFEGAVGAMKLIKISQENYVAYEYLLIEEQKAISSTIQMATVVKNLAASDSTVMAIYGKANEFAGKNTTAADFDATSKKLNLNKRIGDNIKAGNFTIAGLGAVPRDMIRWAFEKKVGDISSVFQLGESRYVVAKLIAVQEKGLVEVTAANRPIFEQKIKDEKKAEAIGKKYAGSASLDAIAQASNSPVQQADTVILGGGYVPVLGYEPKVTGYAFNKGFNTNTLSPAIKGTNAVYFIMVTNRNVMAADNPAMGPMVNQQRYQMEGQLRNQIGQVMQSSLIKMADVNYNVSAF